MSRIQNNLILSSAAEDTLDEYFPDFHFEERSTISNVDVIRVDID